MVRQEYQLNAVPSRLRPAPEKNFAIGSLLLQAGYPEEALPWLQRAAGIDGSIPQLLNVGVCLRQLGALGKAAAILGRLAYEQNFAHAWANLGMVDEDEGNFHTATACYKNAHTLAPRNPTIALNYAMSLLREGNWAEAWPLWEFGRQPDLQLSNAPRLTHLKGPNDDAFPGKSLLIVPEGGYGDLIWLMRYFPMLKERGFKIHLWTWDSLLPLLEKHPWIDELLPASQGVSLLNVDDRNQPISLRYDYQIPLMSIPAVLGIEEPSVVPPYISAEGPWGVPPAVPTPAELHNKRIGICWKAEETYTARKHRSLPDEACYQITGSKDSVQWVSLVPDTGDVCIPKDANWLETARIMHGLDLVISVDTATCHLAGAMGLPCWLLLPMRSDWKWGLPEKPFEWYPNMRVFQQTDPISWDNVIQEVCQSLKEL